jgi:hypothetical protein
MFTMFGWREILVGSFSIALTIAGVESALRYLTTGSVF